MEVSLKHSNHANRVSIHILFPVLLFSLLLVACNSAPTATLQPVTTTASDQVAAQATLPPTQTRTATPTLTSTPTPPGAEFGIRAGNFRIEEDRLKVDVCIRLPDDQDWMVGDVQLLVNDQALPQEGGELILYEAPGVDNQPGQRCDTLQFLLPLEIALDRLVLQVAGVSAYPREGQYCEFFLNQVQPTLAARDPDFQVTCQEQPGYADAQVAQKPANLSQVEAEATAFSPEFYTVPGNWQFTVQDVPTVTPFPTVALDDPSAQPYALFRTLNQALDTRLQVPGWYAVREEWQHDVDNPSSHLLLSGDPRPGAYQIESWYHVDDNGRVDEMVSLLRDPEENILEVYAFANGQYVTSAAPQEAYPQQPYRLHLNEQYLGNLIANLRSERGRAERSELDGIPAMLFTLEEIWSTPLTSQHYNQPIAADLVQAYVDLETGQLLFLKTIATLADGSERVMEQMRLQVSAVDEPPPSVLDILQELK